MSKTKKKVIYFLVFWFLILMPLGSISYLFYFVANNGFGRIPDFEELDNPELYEASLLLSDSNDIIGQYFIENRRFIEYEQISPHLIDALIATEDVRFRNHAGIDFRGTMRAIIKTGILQQKNTGGASTITQQLAKLLYSKRHNNFIKDVQMKLTEWVIAIKMEKRYTKNEIITLYLNHFDFLYQSYGIQSAANTYFNTTPDSLNLEQAAMLVGMLKNPALFNPVRRPDTTEHRRNVVLGQMLKYDYIDRSTFDSISKIPISLDFQRSDHNVGVARHFYENIRLTLMAQIPERKNYSTYYSYKQDSIRWANDPIYGWCHKNIKPDGSTYNLYTDGLRIYSTLNLKYQEFAEKAVTKHLKEDLQPTFFREKKGRSYAPFPRDFRPAKIEKIMNAAIRQSERYRLLKKAGKSKKEIKKAFNTKVNTRVYTWNGMVDTLMTPFDSIRYYKHILHSGFVSMEPDNGHIKAYVGNIDFRQFKFDNVTNNTRQVGSTFKPFLYTLAMQEGFSPCHLAPNVPVSFPVNDTIWMCKNSGSKSLEGKNITLKTGLAKSINYITAWVLSNFTPQMVVDVAHRMGIKSKIDPVPSVILGTSGISLLEMVNAYSVYANKGVHIEPVFVTKIEDKNGNELANFVPIPTEVIDENTAYLMVNLMEGTTSRIGTAARLRWKYQMQIPIAGKTGTTQNHSDGWFIGITPELVSGVWTGASDPSVRFDGINLGAGSNMALPIWAEYMMDVVENDTATFNNMEFEEPFGMDLNLDCDDVNSNGAPSLKDPFGDDDLEFGGDDAFKF